MVIRNGLVRRVVLSALAMVLTAASGASGRPNGEKRDKPAEKRVRFDSPSAFELHSDKSVKHSVSLDEVHKGI